MGTPELAAHILERMMAQSDAGFRVVAVVTRPDQPRGRGLSFYPSEVAQVATRFSIPVLKPAKIRTPEFESELKSYEPDLLVIAAYGRILPAAILAVPKIMPINVHTSLLPRHRGASPIESAILAGDTETGVTIMRVTEQMDAGGVLLQRAIAIDPADTQGTLKEKLAELGAATLIEAIAMIAAGTIRETPQDESRVTYCKPIEKSDAVIDWRADAAAIERMTRAYDPWPVARTSIGGEDLMVWRARVSEIAAAQAEPGCIVGLKPNPAVRCGNGILELLEVQAAGRKRMSAGDFVRGKRLAIGDKLGG